VGVQEVRWEGSGTEPAGECIFSRERGMRTMNFEQVSVHKIIILRFEHTPTEDKTDDIRGSVYEELECFRQKNSVRNFQYQNRHGTNNRELKLTCNQ
jgi:hypothetical protein